MYVYDMNYSGKVKSKTSTLFQHLNALRCPPPPPHLSPHPLTHCPSSSMAIKEYYINELEFTQMML